ncbi:MAG: hypothetical protein APF76_00910 [Desulfitibacter sp. BRH_c19]|nr:MAG: hypothetical protein APF76_00910 [Desulfitibacter sp. BRH_c19]
MQLIAINQSKSFKLSYLLITLILIGVIFLSLGSIRSEAASDITIIIDGQVLKTDTDPIIEDGRTLVPMRAIFEGLGANVSWNEAARRVTGTKDSKVVILHIGDKTTLVNGQPLEIDVAAKIFNNRTMVPGRFIAETLGAQVNWEASTKTVNITSGAGIPGGNVDQPDLTEKTGVYIGQIDNSFIEIEVAGEAKAYLYPQEYKWVIDEHLDTGDMVRILYMENEAGQLQIWKFENPDTSNVISNVTGIFTGLIDSNSIEIKVDGEYKAFAIPEEMVLTDFNEQDEVLFDYYIDVDFRNALISMKKV